MASVVFLNGEFLPREEAKLSVDERGFLFGDGIYEVTRVVGGRLFESGRHLKRMWRGARELRLNVTMSSEALIDAHLRLLRENGLTDGEAYVYLQITRGAAPRTHHFPPAGTPVTVYLSATRFLPPDEKRAAGVSAVTYPDYRWSRCDLKTVNLLPAVMAKQHAADHDAFESIFVRGAVLTEGSHTNVFGVLDGELRTYPNSNFVLPGVTRDLVVELAKGLDFPVNETPIYTHEVPQLTELFLTGTTSDVMPIVRLDGAVVGDGVPGPIARQLHEALVARMAEAAPLGAGAR
ncbi:MAG: D-alanine aminotransferase [Gemmatimonadaceae bacterium]|nr:D-alanine aminotransferase [Gemmatimonadaceae bacterium]